ncbi:MAG: ferrous iron transport protein A [Peptococcaceae bacterium]|nr:ferrous iron transport protein A [Peptococcaceae bacterium]
MQGAKPKNKSQITLSQIKEGSACTIAELHLEGLLRRRIMDLGFVPGTAVQCVRKGPTGDPIAYTVRGTTIALRKEDAAKINVFMA